MSKERLTRATMTVKTSDGLYLTVCKACKTRRARIARSKGEGKEEFSHPSVKFGTKPEANEYLRKHERTRFHHENVRVTADRSPGQDEELLRSIFGERPDQKPTCDKCGQAHASWVTCRLRPKGR